MKKKPWLLKTKLHLLTIASGGICFQLSNCDAQLRTTVENGLLDTFSALYGAVLQSIVELATESLTGTAT